MKRIAILSVVAAVFCIGTSVACAQTSYPTKPVKLIVPVTTGGPSDLVARILGDKLSTSFGKPVVIENRPGASQTVGANAVAKAEPDGYTLLQAAANMAINPLLMKDLPYDTVKDFAPISLTHLTPYVFVVSSQSPINTIANLLKRFDDMGLVGKSSSPEEFGKFLMAEMNRWKAVLDGKKP